MKNILLLMIFIMSASLGVAQSPEQTENIKVTNAMVNPDPTPIGGVVDMCFTFSAENGITFIATNETVDFNLSFQFVTLASIENVTIDSPDFIEWTFLSFLQSWEGVISEDVPPGTEVEICFNGLIAEPGLEITEAQADANAGIGFFIDLVPHSLDPSGLGGEVPVFDEDGNPTGETILDCDDDAFYTFTTDDVVTPIELGEFTAEAVDIDAELNWTTLTEINNSHFEIERSLNGSDWEFVNTIESQAFEGNSDQELNYNFVDKSAISFGDRIFYRLRQVDLGEDALFSFTPIRLVTFDENVTLETLLFPNPVISGQSVNVQGNDIRSIEVYNTNGELVNLIEENGVRSTSIGTSNLARGLYIVVINNKEKLKFIVQ